MKFKLTHIDLKGKKHTRIKDFKSLRQAEYFMWETPSKNWEVIAI